MTHTKDAKDELARLITVKIRLERELSQIKADEITPRQHRITKLEQQINALANEHGQMFMGL